MPLVRIKPNLSHAHYSAGDEFDASPAEVESFGDKFILLEEDADELTVTVIEQEITNALADQFVDATPSARKLAAEHGISLALSDITGTGAGGRITKADVEALLNKADTVSYLLNDSEVVLNGDAE